MFRLPKSWFKRQSSSGVDQAKQSNPVSERTAGNKPSIYEEAVSWENSRHEALEKSEARAWSMVRWTSLLAVLAMTALVILAPFYKIVPLTFEVDKLTGQAQLVDLTGPMPMTSTEAMDKHWVADYVRTRERFVWTLLQLDYDHTMNLSDERVAREYRAEYEGPNARDKRLGPGTDERVKILGVTLPPNEPGKAVVRFERTTRRDGTDVDVGFYVATLSYKYEPPALFSKERNVVDNPLGFKVTGFVVDQELKTKVPVSKDSARDISAPNLPVLPAQPGA
ncbi:MAG: virB8 family protein [Fluviibacter phosphoraccumulans]